jgi:hypothetical protein
MKIVGFAILVSIGIAIVPSAAVTASENAPLFTVTISTPHETITMGDQVPIHVVLTNVSDHNIGIDRVPHPSQADCDYRIEVQGVNGNIAYDVYKTYEYTWNCSTALGLGKDPNVLYLKPGEKLEGDTTITKLFHTHLDNDGSTKKSMIFDFTYPGVYVVQFFRKTSIYSKDAEYVPSNKLIITVVAAEPSAAAPQ